MERAIEYLHHTQARRMDDLCHYLEFPSISSDPTQGQAIARCARFTADLLTQAGLDKVLVHEHHGSPVVTGSWKQAPGRPTVLIYGHYDVQPVDPLHLWHHDPFQPHIAQDRVFARGAADDKGQILMHIHAVEALLKTVGQLPVNVTFLIEGEEEIGSPHLQSFLENHPDLLQADLAMISDSSMWAKGMPAITTSLRGLTLLEMTVTGPNHDLHSGSFGGAIANPVEILCRMMAAVKDQEGRILIPGFYDQVAELPLNVRQRVADLPFDPQAFLASVGVTHPWGEPEFSILENIWYRPTFEINGLWGGFTGPGSKTVLPSQAHAKLSMRLVPHQDGEKIAQQAMAFFQAMAPNCVKVEIHHPVGGGGPIHFADDLPAMKAAQRALEESFNHEVLHVGEGGSIPVVANLHNRYTIPTLLLGFAHPDSKPHSPNENFHLPTFHTGTESLVRLLHYL